MLYHDILLMQILPFYIMVIAAFHWHRMITFRTLPVEGITNSKTTSTSLAVLFPSPCSIMNFKIFFRDFRWPDNNSFYISLWIVILSTERVMSALSPLVEFQVVIMTTNSNWSGDNSGIMTFLVFSVWYIPTRIWPHTVSTEIHKAIQCHQATMS